MSTKYYVWGIGEASSKIIRESNNSIIGSVFAISLNNEMKIAFENNDPSAWAIEIECDDFYLDKISRFDKAVLGYVKAPKRIDNFQKIRQQWINSSIDDIIKAVEKTNDN